MTERSTRSRAAVAAAGLATLSLLLAAAGPAAGQTTITTMAYISPEKAVDLGWNQQGLVGAQTAADGVRALLIKADGSGYDDPTPFLNQLKEDGAQFIVAQASGYTTLAAQFAHDTGIPVIVYDQPLMTSPDLVADVATDSQEGGYLAGVLAASMTRTGKLGIVISADDTNWHKQAGGFVGGARSVNAAIEFLPAQISAGGYGDAAGGESTTAIVIAGGADIIFGMGDGSSFGMLRAIENATPVAPAEKVWFIDVIGNKSSIDVKGVLLSSVLWDFAGTYTQALVDLAAGTFGDAGYTLNLANGGISLLETAHITPEVWALVEAASVGIANGSIAVPLTPKQVDFDVLLAAE